MRNKNPQVKEGTLKFLSRCLATSTQPISPAQVKPLCDALAPVLEDSFAGARDEAATSLGTLMRMVGERPLSAVMEGLADMRKAKVKEAFEKATVKAKAGAGGPPKAAPPPKEPPKKAPAPAKKAPAPAAAPPPPPPIEDDVPASPVAPPKSKGPPARLLAKKPPAAAGAAPSSAPAKKPPAAAAAAAAAAAKPSKSAAFAAPGALDTFKFKHSPEDAEALVAELIPANIVTDFGDANWKTRLAALDEMTTWVEGAVDDLDAEVVVRFLAKRGSNEKNFQVSFLM